MQRVQQLLAQRTRVQQLLGPALAGPRREQPAHRRVQLLWKQPVSGGASRQLGGKPFESPDLEVPARWARPSPRGLWGGHALTGSHRLKTETLTTVGVCMGMGRGCGLHCAKKKSQYHSAMCSHPSACVGDCTQTRLPAYAMLMYIRVHMHSCALAGWPGFAGTGMRAPRVARVGDGVSC